MPARRFLWAFVIIIMLVIAAAVAYRLFGFQIMRALLVPRDPISAEAPPPAPDYTKASSWQARPDIKDNPALYVPNGFAVAPKPGVALFFVTPTGFINRSHWNAEITDKDMRKLSDMMMRGQASAFNGVAAIYAPWYRQATFGAFLTDRPDARQALDLAYSDVLRAFDVFLASIPADQPIILAGHSQGSLHLMRLMHDRVAGTPLAHRIVAAYIVGWPVSEQADLPAMGLPACTDAEATGCVLSWQSFADPAETRDLRAIFDAGTGLSGKPRAGTAMLCTNPLLGRATMDVALPARNLGALDPKLAKEGKPMPAGAIGAACRSDGFLGIGDPPSGFGSYVLPGNNYHVYDYNMFWANVRADAEARTNAFLSRTLTPTTTTTE